MTSDVNLRRGMFITFISKYSNIIVQLIINSILARLLGPEEFGVVAVITVFTTFFTILGDMGIGPAIIQDKTLENKDISNIFKFSIIASVIIGILFYIFSYFISFFFSNKIYVTLGFMLAFSVMFNILKIVPNAVILKNKNFKLAGIINISVNIIVGIITIALAFYGLSYYALVVDSVLKSCFIFIISLIFCGLKIEKGFEIDSIKKIKSYSTYQFSFNFINYFTRNLDNILTGKFLGANSLAYYDKAYKLMLYPIQNLTHVITPVLHPVLSEYQNNREIIYESYMKVVKILAYIGIFISVFCFFSSKEIIRIMYGSNWDIAIPIFKILSLSIVVQMILSSIGSIFQATGEVDKLFSTGVISSIFTVSAIMFGIIKGDIVSLAIGVSISFLFNFIQCFYVLITKVFNRNFVEFLIELKNIPIIGGIMILGYLLLNNFSISNILLSVIIKLSVGIICYLIGLVITKEYLLVKNIIFKRKGIDVRDIEKVS